MSVPWWVRSAATLPSEHFLSCALSLLVLLVWTRRVVHVPTGTRLHGGVRLARSSRLGTAAILLGPMSMRPRRGPGSRSVCCETTAVSCYLVSTTKLSRCQRCTDSCPKDLAIRGKVDEAELPSPQRAYQSILARELSCLGTHYAGLL
jgi:hypothetical protein